MYISIFDTFALTCPILYLYFHINVCICPYIFGNIVRNPVTPNNLSPFVMNNVICICCNLLTTADLMRLITL